MVDARDLPKLNSVLHSRKISGRNSQLPTFLYRELAYILNCDASEVQERCQHSWIRQVMSDFLHEKPENGVKMIKDNAAFLQDLGFSNLALIESLFVLVISQEDVLRLLKEMVVNLTFPLQMTREEESRLLNSMQYQYEHGSGRER